MNEDNYCTCTDDDPKKDNEMCPFCGKEYLESLDEIEEHYHNQFN